MAEPRDEDEHTGGQDPTTPLSPTPSPGHGRAILHAEDITARKRPRLSPRASPGHPRGTESPWAAGGGGGWRGPRAGRVTGLYAQLLRELEAEVGELQRALAARDEAVLHRDRRIRQLELENRQLRSHVRSLEEENDLLSSGDGHGGPLATAATATRTPLASGTGCIGVSDSNVQFLKALVELLEGDAAAQVGGLRPFSAPSPGEQGCALADVPRSPPAWRLRAGLPSGFPPCLGSEEGAGSPASLTDTTCLWEESRGDALPDGTPLWASPIEENGRPKLELVPNSGVYITHPQLDDLAQVPTDKPKLMTRRLLGYFFSRETLARSSATGQRIAHNNTTMERPLRLPVAVVNAIKEYVTKMCGRGCNFNAVINSKCGTSRRAVRKMVVKME
ncbi:uncharacterized protein LOC128919263 [Rissa tridactyla]|uniref:uncharacterized protein LOC128919263 n=1 Tax=Rissa tridactyla TaxID=75485 RepID=UPI0023BA9391|nr:uncharacterized protein LOC128919263 [Rissa tridactyla]